MYNVGNFVRVKRPQTKIGLKKKLRNDLWSDPLEVSKVFSEQNVEIKLNDGKRKTVNTCNIKLKESERLVNYKEKPSKQKQYITRYGRVSKRIIKAIAI